MILKMEMTDLGFRFEWHPGDQRLYCISITGGAHEQIGASITTAEAAQLAVTMWCRGYRTRAREISRNPNVKHHHLLAEGGTIGARF